MDFERVFWCCSLFPWLVILRNEMLNNKSLIGNSDLFFITEESSWALD
jgi:hypothetical protein